MKPKAPEKDFKEDQKVFNQLPVKTRELSLLKDEVEKTTGKESLVLQKKIRKKSG